MLLTCAGVILIIRGVKTGQSQLIILGTADSMVGIIWVFVGLTRIFPLYPIINILTLTVLILVTVAIKKIFYRGRSSPFPLIVTVVSILYGTVIIVSFSIHVFNLIPVSVWTRLVIYYLVEICNLIVHGWFTLSGFRSYRLLKMKNVDPKITKKLKLTAVSAIFSMMVQIPDLFRLDPSIPYIDPEYPFTVMLLIIQITLVVIGAAIFFAAWVPPFIKSLTNHIYQLNEVKDFDLISEEEVKKQLEGGNTE
jgi:hypothetical protein